VLDEIAHDLGHRAAPVEVKTDLTIFTYFLLRFLRLAKYAWKAGPT
jgi:hypothetical protein